MGKRTGLVLATIHQGSSTALWKAIGEEARKNSDSALFVFPVGRLNYVEDNEYLRNDILSLVNKENLDGAIIWSSSLTGKLGYDKVGEYVQKLKTELPVVSLGLSIEGIPSVNFNAYSGFFSVVDHLIRVHGCRKIAMVRGPENHQSAESRFLAYKDALDTNGIAFDSKLVSSPHVWAGGWDAIKELVEGRSLMPGKDFEAIVFASDLLMFWASKYLDKIGVRVPSQVKIVGFNDSEENSLMSVESTTVKMPIKALASASYSLIGDIENNPSESSVEIMLPTDMVLRHSCGCNDSFGGLENAQRVISSWDGLSKWLKLNLEEVRCADLLCTALKDIYSGKIVITTEEGRSNLNAMLEMYFKEGGKTKFIFESLKLVEAFLSSRPLSIEERDILFSLVSHQQSRNDAGEEFEERRLNRLLNSLKLDLLATGTDLHLIESLKNNLPSLGVTKAFICTYIDDNKTLLRGGFSGNTLFRGGEEFESVHLLAPLYGEELSKGLFVVLPLIYDTNTVGYMVLCTDITDGEILEDIRTSVSAALKGISLFSIASEKSKKAEDEEKRSAEFYARLSEGLKQPLEAIKKLVLNQSPDKEALLANVTQAEHLLELSLAEKGEVDFNRQFVPLSKLIFLLEKTGIEIHGFKKLPSIEIDVDKMAEVFRILSTATLKSGDKPCINLELEATLVSFTIYGKEKRWKPAINEKDTSILLSEKIVLLHGGSFSFSSTSIKITLPFTALSGEIKTSSNIGTVLFISDDKDNIPDSLIPLNPVIISQEELLQTFVLPPNTISIAMEIGSGKTPSNILINLLKNHISTKELSFILYGIDDTSISLATALEGSLPKSEKATIFSFGKFPQTLAKLKEFGTVVESTSLEEAENAEGNGSLVVFYQLDISSINHLRASKKFNKTPILIVKDYFKLEDAEVLAEIPNVLLVNSSITESEEFLSRIVGIFGGSELLPALTSVLVKKAIAYINKNASAQISRWQLAEAVNISEDYLTRIFRKEIGISPWDYLNRYRIQLACKLLTQTGLSINEIAQDTGFQDQAYFCRVFKKLKGFPPGHIRQRI